MHHALRRAVLEFLNGRIDAPSCARHLDRLSHRLPKAAAEAQFYLLGSHDVSRVLHDLGGDAQLVALALAIQFAYPGIAALYYGDEVGLDGGGNPGCRAAYPWDRPVTNDLRPLVTHLAAQWRANPTLRRGSLQCPARGADAVEVVRKLDGGAVT